MALYLHNTSSLEMNRQPDTSTPPIAAFLERRIAERFCDARLAKAKSTLRRKENVKINNPAKFKIVSASVINNQFVQYKIEATQGVQFWRFNTRYSTLQELNDNVKHDMKINTQFPEKKIFGNFNPAFIKSRVIKLQSFLDTLSIEALDSISLKQFIQQSRDQATYLHDPQLMDTFDIDF